MRKGYYYFRECRGLNIFLYIINGISFFGFLFFLFFGKPFGLIPWGFAQFDAEDAWCLFFLLLSFIIAIIHVSLHRICRDIATLLKDIEDNN